MISWRFYVSSVVLSVALAANTRADDLQPGVRGLATRAPQGMKIDGDLAEFKDAFCTPVCYFEGDLKNRAAQFFYMWDDEAFYAGLRTLDEKMANHAPDNQLWEGDGVEWYFDTRRGDDFRDAKWGPGAVHMYWTGFKAAELKPRWCLRPDMLQAIPGTGVEVGSRKTGYGSETEFKLPWANFKDFKPELNAVIALDAELCYSDGGPRVYRTFAYGSPLSVQQPASQAKVQLVEKLERKHWKQCGPVMMPIRCDTPWTQDTKGLVTGYMAVPPNQADQVKKYIFRLVDLGGKPITDYEAKVETIQPDGNFKRATVRWPIDVAAPGSYHLVGLAIDKEGKELARVAPRMVSVHMSPGY
jgi:hypothetical protein